MEMVKAIGLKKYYVTDSYEVHALDGVTFSVEDGEFLTIVGTSGSGKTTLLNLLGGLDVPTEGGVWIRGKSLKDMVAEERTIFRRRNIGFVFQQYNLVPMLSVYENIVLPLWLDGTGIDQELFEEIVMLLGIQNQLERLPGTLSGGQQQRVGIARALAADAKILLMDEPFGALDEITKRAMQNEMLSLQKQLHMTIVFITHDIQEAMKLGDRVLVMEKGRIAQLGTPREIQEHPADDFVRELTQW